MGRVHRLTPPVVMPLLPIPRGWPKLELEALAGEPILYNGHLFAFGAFHP